MTFDPSPADRSGGNAWPVRWLDSPPELVAPQVLPAGDAPGWKPLRRHRRTGERSGSDRALDSGWARIGWTNSALVVDFIFTAIAASNRATRMNERTHQLGDVGEIFLQWLGADRYIEVHVTPENQRLQLGWNPDALGRVRQGKAALEEFAVADPEWVRSVSRVTPSFWSARVVIPAPTIAVELRSLNPDTPLLAAICRYDYGGSETAVLSSTADFQGGPFHTRTAWDRLLLLPPGA